MLYSRFAPIVSLVLLGACVADTPTVPSSRGPSATAARTVTITDLGVLPGYDSSAANAINDNGYIAGVNRAVGFGPRHATLWGPRGAMTDLGVIPTGSTSVGLGINGSNVVVGYADTGSFTMRAFRWVPPTRTTPASMSSLPVLNGGSFDIAYGINDAGVVVGASDSAFSTGMHPVRWDGPAVSVLLGLPGEYSGAARAINNAADIVGESSWQAVIWVGGGGPASVLAAPAGVLFSSGTAINDLGQIAGTGQDGAGLNYALYWSGAAATAVKLTPLAPGAHAQATGINRSGSIVGWSADATGFIHPVYWRDASSPALDLGVLPGQISGMATAINRRDEIAGWNSGGPPLASGRAVCWSFRRSGC